MINKLDFNQGGINVYCYDDGKLTNRKRAKTKDHLKELLQNKKDNEITKIILECSTKGDKRFSAFGANVPVFGHRDIIEFHYFLAKRFDDVKTPDIKSNWRTKMDYVRQVKNKKPKCMMIQNNEFDIKLLSQWYHLLWIKYLDNHPELVEYLKLFDDFNDIFRGKSISCQAESIRKYIKEGRKSLLRECGELINKLWTMQYR